MLFKSNPVKIICFTSKETKLWLWINKGLKRFVQLAKQLELKASEKAQSLKEVSGSLGEMARRWQEQLQQLHAFSESMP